jgi:peptidoglycan biosynthesis protein MviN/MurJ (putative lipid II flippase)
MDMGRESRWEKDAMTVEIVFALVTAAALAGLIFAVAWTLALTFGLSGSIERRVLAGGALLGAVAGVWRLVRVLLRFDKQRRMGR